MLWNSEGRRYISIGEDVGVRLDQHKAGDSKWTAKHRPWRLKWTSGEMTPGEARKLENLLKRQKGGDGLQVLLDEHRGS